MAATSTKTIEYAFDSRITAMDADVTTTAGVTRHDFTQITLYSPETTSRSFKNATIVITARDNVTAANSMSAWLIGIKLGATAFDDVTVTDTIVNTGEQQSYVFTRDVTSYFNTNFGSGTSQTCQVGVAFTLTGATAPTNSGIAQTTAKLILTYEYDESAHTTTRVKTVRIPIESNTDRLTATLAELGTNQVPALDTFLPEASKTYRKIWFEVMANEACSATTDHTPGLSLDAEAEAPAATLESGLNSSCFWYYIWQRDNMTTNATHAFKARSTTANRMANMCAVLCVTYEYNHSTSTSFMNSLMLTLPTEPSLLGGTGSGDMTQSDIDIWIQEPTTITLKQSALFLAFEVVAGATLNVAAGAQANKAYTITAGTNNCGQNTVMHRIDSGGTVGTNFATLARGKNTLSVKMYSGTAGECSLVTGLVYLNYLSGKAAGGDSTHNKTIVWPVFDTAADAVSRESGSIASNIVESSYYINDIGFIAFITGSQGSQLSGYQIELDRQSGEGEAEGWEMIYNAWARINGEIGIDFLHASARSQHDRWDGDLDTKRLGIETSRKVRLSGGTNWWAGMIKLITYHSVSWTVAGAVTNYGGAGTGITVTLHDATTGEAYKSATTTSGGAYTMTWHDNTANVYTEAREDSTHLGRSDDGTAT